MSIFLEKRNVNLAVIFAMGIMLAFGSTVSAAAAEKKVVRMGYYENDNFQAGAGDDLVKSGYSYEYMRRLQKYTDWEYEYVYGEYGDLYNQLVAGDIDLLTGLAYKPEREEILSYPEEAMGGTPYAFLKRSEEKDITEDPKTIAGRKIGVLEGAMEGITANYLKDHNIEAEIVLFGDIQKRNDALVDGSVDMIITEGNGTDVIEGVEAFAEAGESDFYVVVNKERPDITDTGIGMSEEFLPHLFEEFAREQTSTVSKIEGTGLGMPIVKRLVEFMDGTIEVSSELGKGTSISVTLPHKITDRTSLTNYDGVEVDPKLFQGKRILLAEDIAVNAEIACAILGEAGFVVDRAENGQECVDMLENAEAGYYDLILMDIQMPVMNGYEATRMIRNMDNRSKGAIPIVAMTANAFEEDKREAYRAGMNGHVAKPINVKQLMQTLAQVL